MVISLRELLFRNLKNFEFDLIDSIKFEKQHYSTELIYVHELCRCRQFTYFELHSKKNPDIKPHTVIGCLVERGLDRFIKMLYKPSLVTKRDVQIITKSGVIKTITIAGKVDYIYDDGKLRFPVEVKYSSKNIIRNDMIIQCKLYAWLYNAEFCKLLIFTPDEIIEQDYEPFSNNEVIEHVQKWLNTAPLWEWECQLCPYSQICDLKMR